MRLTVERADNGWIIDWHQGREMQRHRRVFDNADSFLTEVGHLMGAIEGEEFVEVYTHGAQQEVHSTAEPGTPDALVDELLPPQSNPGE